jgi:hypothetical protein
MRRWPLEAAPSCNFHARRGTAGSSTMRVGCLLLAVTATSALNAHSLLRPVTVLHAVDGSKVKLTDQWESNERAVVVLMRSFG